MSKKKKRLRYPRPVIDKIVDNKNNWFVFFNKQAELTGIKNLIPRQRKNGDYTTICPIHEENTPSFRIRNVNGNLPGFKCFGCGHGGTFIKMIMETYFVSFGEAVEMIKKEEYKIIPRFNPKQTNIYKTNQEPSYDKDKFYEDPPF